jgi:hypothetical protein
VFEIDFIHLKAFELEYYRNDLVGAKPEVYTNRRSIRGISAGSHLGLVFVAAALEGT